MQPTTSDFQQWSSYSLSLASLSATPLLVPHSHPFKSSLSMSLPLSTTSSNIEVVSPFYGSQSGMSSTLDSCGDITPTPDPPSLLPNPTQLPSILHCTHPMTTHF